MKIFFVFALTLALFGTAQAQSSGGHDAHHPGSAPSATLTEGEVRKVDKDAGKLTIKHGEIKNLEMPPMTMVFRVKDPAMLEQVKSGDKVRFAADNVGGAYTVTTIEVAK